MNTKTFLTALIITSITSVIALSSFKKEIPRPSEISNPDGEVAYKANSKEVSKKGNLTLSSAFENDYYSPFAKEGFYYVELKADKYANNEYTKTPLNISIVIDRSGSMAGEKLKNAKKAAKYLIEQLSSEDYASVVIYDDKVDLLFPTSTLSQTNKQLVKNKIDNITDRGGTNLMGGAMKGYDEVKRFYKDGYINRVLLLSDGQANEGITDLHQIEKIVRMQNNENGISISTFGLGTDYNEDLMTSMAETGTGNYYFIKDAENVANIFQKELNGLKEVVAKNTTLTIAIPEFVNIQKVYGNKYEQKGNQLTVQLRDIFSEETKGILIKYKIQNEINMSVKFSAKVSFMDVAQERNQQIETSNKQMYTSEKITYNEYFNEWVSAQVALYESNEKLEIAMKEVDKGNYNEARKIVKENKAYMASKSKLVSKSIELQRASDNNSGYESSIENAEAMPVEEMKVMQKSTKSMNYQIRNKK